MCSPESEHNTSRRRKADILALISARCRRSKASRARCPTLSPVERAQPNWIVSNRCFVNYQLPITNYHLTSNQVTIYPLPITKRCPKVAKKLPKMAQKTKKRVNPRNSLHLYPLNYNPFMQNKANFQNAQKAVTSVITSNYEQNRPCRPPKTKPKQSQFKANFKNGQKWT